GHDRRGLLHHHHKAPPGGVVELVAHRDGDGVGAGLELVGPRRQRALAGDGQVVLSGQAAPVHGDGPALGDGRRVRERPQGQGGGGGRGDRLRAGRGGVGDLVLNAATAGRGKPTRIRGNLRSGRAGARCGGRWTTRLPTP